MGTSLRSRLTILMASRRISMMLLMRASNGARGNAATKMVVKLNWITAEKRRSINQIYTHDIEVDETNHQSGLI